MEAKRGWRNPEIQRKFLDELGKKLNIVNPQDWASVSAKVIINNGGNSVLNYHGRSILRMLSEVYPDKKWDADLFRTRGMLKNREQQIQFFENLTKKLQINKLEEWGKVRIENIPSYGIKFLLAKYNNSLFQALSDLFPDKKWKASWFSRAAPKGYWSSKDNQRKFFLELADKLNIQDLKDWGTVTIREIIESGGSSLIFNKYNGSVENALRSIFPEHNWKREWFVNADRFPLGYWKNKDNQRNFFESLRFKFQLKQTHDLIKLSKHKIRINGGYSILAVYRGNIRRALQSAYPEIHWIEQEEENRSVSYWNSIENQKKFLEKIASDYFIKNPEDWRKLSASLIKQRGGMGLLRKYNRSLLEAVQFVYGTNSSGLEIKHEKQQQDNSKEVTIPEHKMKGMLVDLFVN